jgi:hypothetical protein
MRPTGGQITCVRLLEELDGRWTTFVTVSWRDEEWSIVYDYLGKAPRRYKSVSLAIAHVRNDYDYFGRVIVDTLRRADTPERPERRSDKF